MARTENYDAEPRTNPTFKRAWSLYVISILGKIVPRSGLVHADMIVCPVKRDRFCQQDLLMNMLYTVKVFC